MFYEEIRTSFQVYMLVLMVVILKAMAFIVAQ